MKWSRALYAILIFVVLAFLYGVFVLRTESIESKDLSEVAQLANQGQVESILVDQNELTIELKNDEKISSNK